MTKLFDCTIRDGGHLNNWKFDDECVIQSYNAALNSGADYFEIGYRNQDKNNLIVGKFYNIKDDDILELIEPNEKCKISVMIDSGKSATEKFSICKKELTPITAVRVATYCKNLDIAINQCEELAQKGYEVFLNLMAFSEFNKNDYKKLKSWMQKNVLKSLYFADSFGAFLPEDIEKYYNILKNLGFENISFHSHNNLQLAFANSLKAIELGFYSIDISVKGMGRGAGILPAELITGYLSKNNKNISPIPYLSLIENYYNEYYQNTPWGYDAYSLISGLKNVHPNYIKELNKEKKLSYNEIWKISV